MNFSFHIARRYLFAKKSHNAVNIISIVSVVGVCVGTIALVIVMSVFNGFEVLTKKMYSSFDPDLKVTASAGKIFSVDSCKLQLLNADPDVLYISQTVEENVIVQYGEQQEIAVMKGVDGYYSRVSGIDTMIYEGQFLLRDGEIPQAVVGLTMAYKLHVGLNYFTPLHFWLIRNRPSSVSLNPETALNDKYIFPSGKFAIDEEIDSQYIIVPLGFAQDLLEIDSVIIGSLEIKLKPGANDKKAQKRVSAILGDGFDVKTTYQQKEFTYKVLKSEKFMAFMILSFVLLIASFNVVCSLSMLMIEKKSDLFIFQSMGADRQMLSSVFMIQGWMIVLFGAIAGLLIGGVLCYLQDVFGFFKVTGSGTYIIDAYPVAIRWSDFALILVAVISVSFLTIYFPVKIFVKKYLI